jgi:hypothetical protein
MAKSVSSLVCYWLATDMEPAVRVLEGSAAGVGVSNLSNDVIFSHYASVIIMLFVIIVFALWHVFELRAK